jgi:hypothetical protein
MKRFYLFLLALLYLAAFGIDSQAKEVTVKMVKGIKHIYNPAQPLKGEVTLNLEKSLTIDPAKLAGDEVRDLFFDDFERDEQRSIFLIDRKNATIHKFTGAGKYIKSFLRKGEGPGETSPYPGVQILGSDIWITDPQKFIRYDVNGTYLDEFKFKKFYHSETIIHDNRFIADYEERHDNGKQFTKITGLFSIKDEKNILNFFEAENVGKYFVKLGKGPIAIFPPVGIIPDIVNTFDFNTGRLYVSLNRNYEIFVKNLSGDIQLVIHKESKNPVLKDNDKVDIVNNFVSMPENWKKTIIESLPDRQCALAGITALSNGHFMVKHILAYKRYGLDVFSKNGEYLYLIKMPENFDLKKIKFYKGVLSGIEEREDTNVYHEYKIKSLPGVFGSGPVTRSN